MDDHKKDSKKFPIYLFGLLVTGIHPPLAYSYCRHVLVWHVQYLAFLSLTLLVNFGTLWTTFLEIFGCFCFSSAMSTRETSKLGGTKFILLFPIGVFT